MVHRALKAWGDDAVARSDQQLRQARFRRLYRRARTAAPVAVNAAADGSGTAAAVILSMPSVAVTAGSWPGAKNGAGLWKMRNSPAFASVTTGSSMGKNGLGMGKSAEGEASNTICRHPDPLGTTIASVNAAPDRFLIKLHEQESEVQRVGPKVVDVHPDSVDAGADVVTGPFTVVCAAKAGRRTIPAGGGQQQIPIGETAGSAESCGNLARQRRSGTRAGQPLVTRIVEGLYLSQTHCFDVAG